MELVGRKPRIPISVVFVCALLASAMCNRGLVEARSLAKRHEEHWECSATEGMVLYCPDLNITTFDEARRNCQAEKWTLPEGKWEDEQPPCFVEYVKHLATARYRHGPGLFRFWTENDGACQDGAVGGNCGRRHTICVQLTGQGFRNPSHESRRAIASPSSASPSSSTKEPPVAFEKPPVTSKAPKVLQQTSPSAGSKVSDRSQLSSALTVLSPSTITPFPSTTSSRMAKSMSKTTSASTSNVEALSAEHASTASASVMTTPTRTITAAEFRPAQDQNSHRPQQAASSPSSEAQVTNHWMEKAQQYRTGLIGLAVLTLLLMASLAAILVFLVRKREIAPGTGTDGPTLSPGAGLVAKGLDAEETWPPRHVYEDACLPRKQTTSESGPVTPRCMSGVQQASARVQPSTTSSASAGALHRGGNIYTDLTGPGKSRDAGTGDDSATSAANAVRIVRCPVSRSPSPPPLPPPFCPSPSPAAFLSPLSHEDAIRRAQVSTPPVDSSADAAQPMTNDDRSLSTEESLAAPNCDGHCANGEQVSEVSKVVDRQYQTSHATPDDACLATVSECEERDSNMSNTTDSAEKEPCPTAGDSEHSQDTVAKAGTQDQERSAAQSRPAGSGGGHRERAKSLVNVSSGQYECMGLAGRRRNSSIDRNERIRLGCDVMDSRRPPRFGVTINESDETYVDVDNSYIHMQKRSSTGKTATLPGRTTKPFYFS